ncbi:MAG: ribose 5-phosphate isomerase B [bacterium]|jgi:ribose 5-phosphate isomerase B|nr:ribose 5-phosphate isomerase B [Planctomycetaceae bacterium]
MKIALGCDHRGAVATQALIAHLKADGHEVEPISEMSGAMTDYPDSAYAACIKVARGEAERAILICGTGIGMCIAANKIRGIRAALAQDELSAQLSRTHNDANVLCLSADLLGHTLVKRIVDTWVHTPFDGGRHLRRLHKIEAIERGEDPSALRA